MILDVLKFESWESHRGFLGGAKKMGGRGKKRKLD